MINAILLIKGAKQTHHHIRLSVEIRSYLAWWKLFAASWNGKALIISLNSAQHHFTLDALKSWGLWGLVQRQLVFPAMGPNTQLSAYHSKRDSTNYVGSLNMGPFLEGWASNSAL